MNSVTPNLSDDALQPQVLLVDDDEVTLLLSSIALRERGFTVHEASNGTRALQMLTDQMPDVVVLDALMPGLDGFQTCQALRELPGYESLPVLMLTGLDDEVSINRAYEVGATDFFVKSNHWGLLAGRLRYLLRSARTRRELERSKAKLARAQDLARMGSFDWLLTRFVPTFSVEALRVLNVPQISSLRGLLRLLDRDGRHELLGQVRAASLETSVVHLDLKFRHAGQQGRIVHIEAEPSFNEHGVLHAYMGIVQDVISSAAAPKTRSGTWPTTTPSPVCPIGASSSGAVRGPWSTRAGWGMRSAC